MSATPKCDCLNHCGDDPWLKDGRAEPCEKLLAAQLQEKEAVEQIKKVKQIAARYETNGTLSPLELIIMLDKRVEQLVINPRAPIAEEKCRDIWQKVCAEWLGAGNNPYLSYARAIEAHHGIREAQS